MTDTAAAHACVWLVLTLVTPVRMPLHVSMLAATRSPP
jgi:hypothetical protein